MNEHVRSDGYVDFVAEAGIDELLAGPASDPARVRDVIAKSMALEPLTPAETAVLLRADDPELDQEMFTAARDLKKSVYGNRVVFFAPLYIGNRCINDCGYCAFRASNTHQVRRTLTPPEIVSQVEALEDQGHKRLILVFGEHREYDAQYIADTVRSVYDIKKGRGDIRRVNVNAAPLDAAGFKTVHESGIGTYQVFQETYHRATYERYHPARTPKGDYDWRLDSLSRAFESGCDDMGIGALFGLTDWRYDVLGMVAHAAHLQGRYGVGPHTLSFPRLCPADGVDLSAAPFTSDDEFKRLVAILRLAVPYAGMILTARESPEIRREVLQFGVSQVDAGSKLELGAYTENEESQALEREQFELADTRSLDEVMAQVMSQGDVPSFCTACYRMGRTGEQFMEFAVPGFIEKFCTPNAVLTLAEYLEDYASPETRTTGYRLIETELAGVPDGPMKVKLLENLKAVREKGERDLRF